MEMLLDHLESAGHLEKIALTSSREISVMDSGILRNGETRRMYNDVQGYL